MRYLNRLANHQSAIVVAKSDSSLRQPRQCPRSGYFMAVAPLLRPRKELPLGTTHVYRSQPPLGRPAARFSVLIIRGLPRTQATEMSLRPCFFYAESRSPPESHRRSDMLITPLNQDSRQEFKAEVAQSNCRSQALSRRPCGVVSLPRSVCTSGHSTSQLFEKQGRFSRK